VKLLPVDWVLDFGSSRALLGIDCWSEGETLLKQQPNLKRYLNVNDARFWFAFTLSYLVTLTRMKQLYALLIGCIGFFHILK